MTQKRLKPEHTALLVVDIQAGYLDEAQGFLSLINASTGNFREKLEELDVFINSCRENQVPIIWTRMTEDVELSPANISVKMTEQGVKSICTPGERSYDFYKIRPNSKDKIVEKKYYDAFAQTELHEYLKERNIQNVILTGAYASRCVLATAFGANGRGYNVYVVKDLIGSHSKIESELLSTLSIIDSILGFVTSSKGVLAAFGAKE